jgi:outer membrane protein assembly factor BamB
MITSAPSFRFTARYSLARWYGHVQLLPDRILGEWFCLDRRDGRLLWERQYRRPTTIVGVSDGVIIAGETRSDGPWTRGFGCYGLSMNTGELLWTSHRNGVWGRVVRLLDYIPGFTNDLRDCPVDVAGAECICASGRVLDIHTGREVRRIPKEQVRALSASPEARSEAETLYNSMSQPYTRVQIAGGQWLSHRRPKEPGKRGFALYLSHDDDSIIWEFDLASTGYYVSHANFYAARLVRPYVYIVASELPSLVPHATKARHVIPNPTVFRLLTLDLASGRIVQDVRISDTKYSECRIENADDRGVAVSAGGRELLYYGRTL